MLENIIYAFILVFSITLALVAIVSFKRTKSPRIGLVTAAFLLFVTKGVLFSVQLFVDAFAQDELWIYSGLLDIGILATIFLATLKR